ncbi:MAG: HAMP domain-containing protein [Lachnospiraceae bacterium]|jgi:methyl-accepting chemotaxis protein|nr:HAMP domain-containing protein [Lachnospiraceae bacterium]
MKKSINQSTLTIILNGLSILALLFMGLALFGNSHIRDLLNTANAERYDLTYNANRFMNGSAYLTNEVRAFAATGEQQHYDNYMMEVNELKNRDIGVAAMQEIGITEDEQAMIDEMSSLSNELVPLEEESMKMVQNGDRENAIAYVYGKDYSTAITKINSLKEQFLSALDTRTIARIDDLNYQAGFIRKTMLITLIIIAFIQFAIMFVTNRRVLRPVIAVRDQMGEISKGNLSANFALKSNTSEIGMLVESIHETKRELKKYIQDIDDKLAKMAEGTMDLTIGDDYRGEFLPIQNAMRQILDSLNQALSQISITADQVSDESRQMASDAEVLSSGTVRQASAVEELSASIQDIYGQVDRTSKDADTASQHSAEAAKQLQICCQKMEALTNAMNDISEASHQIGGIIKTIEDISFQTNILALNASVEAARAGEAGKGFAIVAGEVQNLANKSSVSAQDIAELIENSMKLVEYGSSLTEETTESISAVVSSAQESSTMIERIAESAISQSHSLQQITQGMEQISEVVQTNASTAQESAKLARDLQNQAEGLKVSVHRFRLRR